MTSYLIHSVESFLSQELHLFHFFFGECVAQFRGLVEVGHCHRWIQAQWCSRARLIGLWFKSCKARSWIHIAEASHNRIKQSSSASRFPMIRNIKEHEIF
ncbi:hypothetical protein MS3_00000761 [Schistosoma haematobium]|uniref:Uncharacterized protein n=1 Tax=Schistosoma haematobium TaxID=6185 RepID=A0A922II36_SCHHA|nr:hypothetical protein MS3_00000761 [Schistosoma haematobium]KAH9579263.1 hypothetical protein MS3_00000761 [Schistosoma haematobium]